MIIKVEQKHIDNGTTDNCKSCMIALAMQDAINHTARCGLSTASAVINGKWTRFYVPEDVQKKIIAFDSGEKALPFDFELIEFSHD